MISLTRSDSATGPTANTASLNALQVRPLSVLALTWVLLVNTTGSAYCMAVSEAPPPSGAVLSPASNEAEMMKSELVR